MEQNTMAVREQQWLETIQTAKKSGLPVNQWCHENGIAESTFYRWQQRIRQHLPGSAEPTAAGAATGSRLCCGRATALCCCTSESSTADSSGPAQHRRCET